VAKRTADGRLHLRAVDCLKAPADHALALGIDEFRREMSRIMGRELVMDEPRWLSRFSDFSRLARTYRSGRVLLAGDAAHLHFPIGAQGLSTGLLDALDLGWKLAFTVLGAAAPGLLDSYDAERRPAAARLLEQIRIQADLMRPGRTPDSLEELAALVGPDDGSGTEAVLGRIGLMVSGQDAVLPPRSAQPCAWEGKFLTNRELSTDQGPTDVIRLLHDGRMLLLRFGLPKAAVTSAVPHALRHVLREVHAAPVAGWPRAALLLRPDGYVAWASDTATDLDEPLARWLAPAGAARAGAAQAEAPASSAASASAWTSA
jgi:monooxygenase